MQFIVKKLQMPDLDKDNRTSILQHLTNMRSSRCNGRRTNIRLRQLHFSAVNTVDFMTAEAAEIPYEVLYKGNEQNHKRGARGQ